MTAAGSKGAKGRLVMMTMGNVPAQDGRNDWAGELPPTGRGVRVRCESREGYECTAYLDAQKKWRNYYNGDLLLGKISILEVEFA